MSRGKAIRVLLAKPGLDGHDVGAKVVARALMQEGFEVVYTGLRKSPEQIARAARDESVDVIGLSILSGSHMPICRQFQALRKEHALEKTLWIVGGNIPDKDHEDLKLLGVDGVFPVGTATQAIAEFIREKLS